MARIEESDVADGSSFSEDGDGVTLIRAFQIIEVTGPAASRHAVAANVPGVPLINAFHPSLIDLRCSNKRVDQQGAETFKVFCTYKRLDKDSGEGDPEPETQITVGTTLQTVQENLDFEGNFLRVDYLAELESDGVTNIPTADLVADPQNKTVDKLEPMTVIKFRRRESDAPEQESSDNVGKLNSANFLGAKPKTVLCTRIEGTSTDGGETYDVDYEFQRRVDGWNIILFYRDSEGNIPPDVGKTPGENGVAEYQLYNEIDFNILKLQ